MPTLIDIPGFGPELSAQLARDEAELAKRNREAWAAGRRPRDPSDVQIDDLVLPCGPLTELWSRGPGRVDEIDEYGRVWAVFGPREGATPDESKPVRCVMPWFECVVVGEATHPNCEGRDG